MSCQNIADHLLRGKVGKDLVKEEKEAGPEHETSNTKAQDLCITSPLGFSEAIPKPQKPRGNKKCEGAHALVVPAVNARKMLSKPPFTPACFSRSLGVPEATTRPLSTMAMC